MVTIADLRARNTLPTWQEAVAVVQELAHATSAGRGSAARLPEIEHISLNVDGTIALLPGSVVPGDPVRHLAYVLLLLLDGVPAPDELIELAQRNRAEDPPCKTLDEFGSALKFFEQAPEEKRLVSFCSIPLKVQDRVIGMLNAYSYTRGHKFSEGQRRMLSGGKPGYGVLCDSRLGRDALFQAAGTGLWIGRPVEWPGSRPLTLEPELGPDFGGLQESVDRFVDQYRGFLRSSPFGELRPKPELTMLGRTYALGYEQDLAETLVERPRARVLDASLRWAIWYPLRRAGSFEQLSRQEQNTILMEHGGVGMAFGRAGLGYDIRLACHGLDRDDNDFVVGLLGPELHPLSIIVQRMRKTKQTSLHLERLGPFFVGRVAWQARRA